MYAYSHSMNCSLAITILAITVVLSGQCAHAQPGTVLSHQKISDTQGGFKGVLNNDDLFGASVASLGDLDDDGVTDLAVGAHFDSDGGFRRGAVWILFLNADGSVKSNQKISDTQGGFTGILDNEDFFGISMSALGDLDGDGVEDLAVGARRDDDGGTDRGAVWILFLNTDGTVKSHQKISDTAGHFGGSLDNGDRLGASVASLGDLDGDGVGDLAVGADRDDDGGFNRGAVWVLFLNTNGSVKSHQKISDTQGGFSGILDNQDLFGWSAGSLGDIDGDGTNDLAVGTRLDDDGGANRGAVWVLFLNTDGTVKLHQKISDTQGEFTGTLDNEDQFAVSAASVGDLDGDGVGDLAVGAWGDDDGGPERGAVWIQFLNTDGTVKSHQKISDTQGGFTGTLDNLDIFGVSTVSLGDLNGDGVGDLAVGAAWDDDGGNRRGAVWILFLEGNPCPWDLDNSGSVGTSDLLALFAQWGTDGPADFDGSGAVGTSDLLILFANWGPCS
ncbi:MAG: FG-GAP repeat protein [Planctomycetes bacterium]|nr:FG-GAP repeat protein [Planctomycetota bacterium]